MLHELVMRAWTDLLGRLYGPLHFRFVVQPAMAILLALRAGLRDARAGTPPFLHDVLSHPERRRARLREAWKDVRTVFVVAVVIDLVYQLRVHHTVYPGETVLTAAILAFAPYGAVRGIVTRIARRIPRRAPST
jgi:hypothetical protein